MCSVEAFFSVARMLHTCTLSSTDPLKTKETTKKKAILEKIENKNETSLSFFVNSKFLISFQEVDPFLLLAWIQGTGGYPLVATTVGKSPAYATKTCKRSSNKCSFMRARCQAACRVRGPVQYQALILAPT